MIELPRRGLYVITDSALIGTRLVETVGAAIDGGAVMVQYRDKGTDGERRAVEAASLLTVCREHQIPLIINDDVELARAIGADGVHLGRDDGSITAARRRLGEEAIVGISCYDDLTRAITATRSGADYVAFGSFFPSSVKPGAVRAPHVLLAEAKARLSVPVVAIGGITAENGGQLLAAGANLLAVISGVFGQSDVRAAAATFTRLFG